MSTQYGSRGGKTLKCPRCGKQSIMPPHEKQMVCSNSHCCWGLSLEEETSSIRLLTSEQEFLGKKCSYCRKSLGEEKLKTFPGQKVYCSPRCKRQED